MYFASSSLSGTLVKMQMDSWRQSFGYADIIIHRSSDSPSPYFYTNGAEQFRYDMEYIIGEISGYASCIRSDGSKTGVRLKGIDIGDLQRLTPFTAAEEQCLYPFKGLKAVISTDAADKLGLSVGDKITLEIGGLRHSFKICAIVHPSGPFLDESKSICAVIPMGVLNSFYNVRGKVDMIYLKLKDTAKKQRYLYLLSREYARYTVEEPFTQWEIKRETDRTAAPVIIVTVILSFMCIYIIYTTYRIIIFERLPVIGVFRSTGATKAATVTVLFVESLLYGLLGGLPGCCLGVGLLAAMSYLTGAAAAGMPSAVIHFTGLQLASTLGIALSLAAVGSFAPIVQSIRLSIRALVLGFGREKAGYSGISLAVGVIVLLLSLAAPFLVPVKQALAADTACVLGVLLAVGLLLPRCMDGLLNLADGRSLPLPCGIGVLAVKNLKGNRTAQNNISMLVIGLSSFYMISTLNYSQIGEISGRFDRNLFDMTMEMEKADRATLSLISKTEGIKDVLGCYYTGRTELDGYEDPIWHILSVNDKFTSFFDIRLSSRDLLEHLDKSRRILLTFALKERLNVEAGDFITLKLPAGNGGFVHRRYEIAGFFGTILQGQWSYALIPEKYFKLDIRSHYYGEIYIKAGRTPEKMMDNLKSAFASRKPVVVLTEDAKKNALRDSRQLFAILQGFTLLTILTGSCGILNNFIIGFLQRKNQIAIIRSVGMSRKHLYGMIFYEALIQGTAGSILGVAAGICTTWIIVPRIIKALNIESSLHFSPGIIFHCFAVGIISVLLASVEPVLRSARLDIVSAVKYE